MVVPLSIHVASAFPEPLRAPCAPGRRWPRGCGQAAAAAGGCGRGSGGGAGRGRRNRTHRCVLRRVNQSPAVYARRPRRRMAGRRRGDARGEPRGCDGGRGTAHLRERRRRSGERVRVPERRHPPRGPDAGDLDERRRARADRVGASGIRRAPAAPRPGRVGPRSPASAKTVEGRRRADGRAASAAARGLEPFVRQT